MFSYDFEKSRKFMTIQQYKWWQLCDCVCGMWQEAWRRSQLWKMTAGGLLCHEGSSVPRDPRNPMPDTAGPMVLDTADMALRPNTESLLKIRRADERRHLSQTWHFTEVAKLYTTSSILVL